MRAITFLLFSYTLLPATTGCRSHYIAPASNNTANAARDTIDTSSFTLVETMPSFPGGEEALMKFVAKHLKIPEKAVTDSNVVGKLVLGFIINKDGSLTTTNMTINKEPLDTLNPIHYIGYALVKSMPNWTPGKQGSRAVRMFYSLPLTIHLQQE